MSEPTKWQKLVIRFVCQLLWRAFHGYKFESPPGTILLDTNPIGGERRIVLVLSEKEIKHEEN